MSKIDIAYQDLCRKIFSEGKEYENKNRGVKRLQIPSYTLRHSFEDGFPALTNKKLYWKQVIGELIWFLRGDNDVTWLNQNGITIWNKDAYNWYKKIVSDYIEPMSFEKFSKIGKGSVGQNYSVQWRNFNGDTDQIGVLIFGMKEDIMSSRLKVNAWNPSETNETALPPCHSEFQVIGVPLSLEQRINWFNKNLVEKEGYSKVEPHFFPGQLDQMLTDWGCPEFGFELHWNQRSVDVFLGLPFNIASYGFLAKILELMTGYPAIGIEGTLKCVHFYDNQYEAAKQLLERDPDSHGPCELKFSDYLIDLAEYDVHDSASLDDVFYGMEICDFNLDGYTSDKGIKVEMLAPKEL